MKSALPKVLHPVCGRPALNYVLDLAAGLRINNIVTVLGHEAVKVKKIIKPGIKIAVQKKLLGTADAVKEGLKLLKNFKGTVLVLCGDTPLLKKETVKKLLDYHIKNKADATVLTAHLDKPQGYGRILRDKYAVIRAIIEEKDADDFQKAIKEVNTGIICFDSDKLKRLIAAVKLNPRKKEYYLTDIIGLFYDKGFMVEHVLCDDINEALGINTRVDLAKAVRIMSSRINEKLMLDGVSISAPETCFISYGLKIGQDTAIYPFTVIEKNVKIGKHCTIGPFVHLREGTTIEDGAVVGNFVEVVRSKISSRTLIKHFSYLGDARVGRQANIGAGTVTANFDGAGKNTTVIGDNAFIGSDTVLVAPVKIGKAAKTGAGAVVTKHTNVPAGATVAGVPARLLKK